MFKRTRKKLGHKAWRTTTHKTGSGVKHTNSRKTGTKGNSVTQSWSTDKSGKRRYTETRNVNGWISRTSKLFGSTKPKTSRSSKSYSSPRRSRRSGSNVSLSFSGWFWIFVGLMLMVAIPASIPIVLGIGAFFIVLNILWMLLPFIVWGTIIFTLIYVFLK